MIEKTPYQLALEVIEMLLSKNNTEKYQIAQAFLQDAKKKLEAAR